ncbi:hypothetical protein V3481_015037 [Fusarium oxysporum f. sp. vasinfectum]
MPGETWRRFLYATPFEYRQCCTVAFPAETGRWSHDLMIHPNSDPPSSFLLSTTQFLLNTTIFSLGNPYREACDKRTECSPENAKIELCVVRVGNLSSFL